jgi:hypothetical protein
VDVWLNDVSYSYGAQIRPYFTTEPGAFVTILRVSTDGELRVLYPRRPGLQREYRIGDLKNDRVSPSGDGAFDLRESSGTGFVFAIASYDRFDYRYYTNGGDWSVSRLAGTGRGSDPFEILRRFVAQTVGDDSEYSMDYVSYNVESTRIRTRYANRYNSYGYDDYYNLCYSAFGFRYSNYCRSYNGGVYGPVIIVTNPGNPRGPRPENGKTMHPRPLVVDPLVPTAPRDPAPVEGRTVERNAAERAAMARREQMLREARPRVEPKVEQRSAPRAAPQRAEPRVYSSPPPRIEAPRAEPRHVEPQHVEQHRAEPQRSEPVRVQSPPRVEVRNAPPPPQRARSGKQKDN